MLVRSAFVSACGVALMGCSSRDSIGQWKLHQEVVLKQSGEPPLDKLPRATRADFSPDASGNIGEWYHPGVITEIGQVDLVVKLDVTGEKVKVRVKKADHGDPIGSEIDNDDKRPSQKRRDDDKKRARSEILYDSDVLRVRPALHRFRPEEELMEYKLLGKDTKMIPSEQETIHRLSSQGAKFNEMDCLAFFESILAEAGVQTGTYAINLSLIQADIKSYRPGITHFDLERAKECQKDINKHLHNFWENGELPALYDEFVEKTFENGQVQKRTDLTKGEKLNYFEFGDRRAGPGFFGLESRHVDFRIDTVNGVNEHVWGKRGVHGQKNDDDDGSGPNWPLIIGITAGVAVFLAIAGFTLLYGRFQHNKKKAIAEAAAVSAAYGTYDQADSEAV